MLFIKNNLIELKKNYKLLILFLFILLTAQFFLQYIELTWPKLYIVLALAAAILLLIVSRISDETKIARNAFVLIFIAGTLNALILPIRQNYDENTHYYHALEVADGKVRNQTDERNFLAISPDFLAITKLPSKPEYGNELNTNLYHKEFLEIESIPSTYNEDWLEKSGFNNPAYIPSAIGISIGRLFSQRVSVHYYLGRIFNVLFYALLAFWAIKVSKVYKLALFVAATTPFAVWISSGFTYDNLYYGLVLLILAQFTNFFVGEREVNFRKIILYMLTCLGLVFCKAPVILLAALPLFVPAKYFDTRKTKKITVFAVLLCFSLGFLWLMNGAIFHIFEDVPAANTVAVDENEDVLSYLISNIGYTITLFLRSYSDVIASIGYFLKNPMPYFMASEAAGFINLINYTLMITLSAMLIKITIPKKTRVLTLATFFVIISGTILAITGDPRVFAIGDLRVPGVQGRYHFYLLAFLPLFLGPILNKVGFESEKVMSHLDSNKITSFCVKTIYVITFFNSCVALYGYL